MNKRKITHQFLAVLSIATLLIYFGCGKEKSVNPVESDASLRTSASISGQVLSSCTGAINGINVSIIGTDRTAATDTQGLFALQGVPLGDQQLVFAQGSYQGTLLIDSIKPGEKITIQVHCESAAVTVQDMARTQETSFQGAITAIDSASQTINVAGTEKSILIDENTVFEGDLHSFGELYVGLEVEGEAVETADNGLVATKIEAEFTEAEFKGKIQSIDDINKSFTIDTLTGGIFTDEYTVYKGELSGFADLQVGQKVKGEGVYKGILNVKHFVATKVEIDTDDEDFGVFRAEIKPDHWNLNWQGSSGQFSVEIRGQGYSEVDTSFSITLQGDNNLTLASQSVKLSGNHVRAFFAKKDAFTILTEAKSGDSHQITITGTLLGIGEPFELSDTIYVLGSPKE